MIGEELNEFMWELDTCIECCRLQGNKLLGRKLNALKRAFEALTEEDFELLQTVDEEDIAELAVIDEPN